MITEINTTDPTYLVGCYQDNEFWARAEFYSKDKAEAAYYHYCQEQPNKHILLVQQVKLHTVLETYYPKNGNC